MTKDQAIEQFVRTMKLALDAGTMYFYEHPSFMQNVEMFKNACDALFPFSKPITLGIATHSLFIADTHLEEGKQYTDLARAFHIKKIKKIELNQGVSVDELRTFLSFVSLPLKDIIQKGGFAHMTQQKNIIHIAVHELDYSELLHGEGEDIGDDVWSYILSEAVNTKDTHAIGQYITYFKKALEKCTIPKLLKKDDVYENIQQFLKTLQEKDENNYRECAKELLKSTLKERIPLTKEQLHQLTSFIKDLKSVDFADSLWEEIITDEHFDALSFNLFSQLTEESNHDDISTSLSEKIQHNKSKLATPHIRKRIKELFSDSSSFMVPEIYRHLLSSALHDTQTLGEIIYDRDHINKNYRCILLDLLSFEKNIDRFQSIIEKIMAHWDTLVKDNDIAYIKKLQEIIAGRSQRNIIIKEKSSAIARRISQHIEQLILDKKISIYDITFFVPYLEKSSFNITTYLDILFKENRINASTLSLIFKLFPHDLELFYARLHNHAHDIQCIRLIIENLQEIDSLLSLKVLQKIYSYSDVVIKQKVLYAMHTLSHYDETFLFPILKKGTYPLRKEIVRIALKHTALKAKIFDDLFFIPLWFGLHSRIIKETVHIIHDLKIYEAESYLTMLARKKPFWYNDIKQQAHNVLEQWKNGKS